MNSVMRWLCEAPAVEKSRWHARTHVSSLFVRVPPIATHCRNTLISPFLFSNVRAVCTALHLLDGRSCSLSANGTILKDTGL